MPVRLPIASILYTTKFQRSYKRLSAEIKATTEKTEPVIRANIFDPRLKTHKLSGKLKDLWSLSITPSNRIIFEFLGDSNEGMEILLHDIGDHRVYQ